MIRTGFSLVYQDVGQESGAVSMACGGPQAKATYNGLQLEGCAKRREEYGYLSENEAV